MSQALNHNTDSRRVSPMTESQTVQAETCIDTLGLDSNSKEVYLRNTDC
jgi:hypothetical protein